MQVIKKQFLWEKLINFKKFRPPSPAYLIFVKLPCCRKVLMNAVLHSVWRKYLMHCIVWCIVHCRCILGWGTPLSSLSKYYRVWWIKTLLLWESGRKRVCEWGLFTLNISKQHLSISLCSYICELKKKKIKKKKLLARVGFCP